MRGSAWVGYDAALVARLPPAQRSELDCVGGAWLWAALMLAAPLAYAATLLTHSAWLSVVVALAALLLLLQLARLTVAGGGVPLDGEAAYEPSLTPVLWLAVLGVMFALPAQLPLWDHATLIANERTRLLAQHERALGQTADSLYARELERCEFVVLRLQALTHEPLQASRYALGYLALLLGPMLFARAQARSAQRRYDELKVAEARRLTARDDEHTRRTLARLLAPYPTYEPSTSPLAARWPRAEP